MKAILKITNLILTLLISSTAMSMEKPDSADHQQGNLMSVENLNSNINELEKLKQERDEQIAGLNIHKETLRSFESCESDGSFVSSEAFFEVEDYIREAENEISSLGKIIRNLEQSMAETAKNNISHPNATHEG